jgi:hypothetical protein
VVFLVLGTIICCYFRRKKLGSKGNIFPLWQFSKYINQNFELVQQLLQQV